MYIIVSIFRWLEMDRLDVVFPERVSQHVLILNHPFVCVHFQKLLLWNLSNLKLRGMCIIFLYDCYVSEGVCGDRIYYSSEMQFK